MILIFIQRHLEKSDEKKWEVNRENLEGVQNYFTHFEEDFQISPNKS